MACVPGLLVAETMALNTLSPDVDVNVDVTDSGRVVVGDNNDRPEPIKIDDNIDGFYRESINTSDDESDFSPSAASSSSNTTTDYFDTTNAHPHHGHDMNHAQSAYYYNNNQNMILNTNYDDDQTYLDLFGERAKELLTRHLIPSTDADCRWDWRTGRCEPYCTCALQFLWGDYHLGRSCRIRQSPPPNTFSKEIPHEGNNEEASWQDAWQEVWQTELTDGTVDSSFLPPLFSTDQPSVADASTTREETSATCTLPPDSRYIQMMNHLANTYVLSTRIVERFHKIKNASSASVTKGMVHGRQHWTNMRQKSCEIVKSKVEERAKGRNQPVVLTRQGATWIRRVCGPTGNDSDQRVDEEVHFETFEGIPRSDNNSF